MSRKEVNALGNLITLHNVEKKYGNHVILQDINLEINRGDSIALIGHNGMGKSTLLKIIGNLEKYNKGHIDYMKDIKISYVPEHFPRLNVTARRYVTSMAHIIGLDKVESEKRSRELYETFYMTNMVDTPIKYLSKGTKQKVAVIQAMLTKPNLLLLDEPLSGQDSDSQKHFIQTVKELNKNGTAIVMSCHEKWLINSLSKEVYEIENKNLLKRAESITQLADYTVMVFEKVKGVEHSHQKLSVLLNEVALKVEDKNNRIEVFTMIENSKIVLLKMMTLGYEIREMYDETMV